MTDQDSSKPQDQAADSAPATSSGGTGGAEIPPQQHDGNGPTPIEVTPTVAEVLQIEVAKLELTPADVLILRVADDMDMHVANNIAQAVEDILGPNARVLMLPKSVEVSVSEIQDSGVLAELDEMRTEHNKFKMDLGAVAERVNEVATAVGSDPGLGRRVDSIEAKIKHFV